ncbi:helix-turn-helix domain-containing protein [Leptolyngbya sp. CCY15150]|uniref:helix-turn-helix domain-containing protein n=1 Tax=Leptolyngbya sp. CCY15150 TaxID=2767772 RepID=UPI00195085A6|nr:helix-turn-helix domain-containing protein [Leptolyngbya sp. CCY15150]
MSTPNLLTEYLLFLSMDTYRSRLSETVARLRGDRSIRRFAKDLGVSFPAARSWEEEESFPNLKNLEKIAQLDGKTLEEFLEYLRGDDWIAPNEITVAEDLLGFIEHLPKSEKVRLAQLLIAEVAKPEEQKQ